jgi:hypothetical protein
MLRYVTISKFAEESGYSELAIRAKIHDGIWPEGQVWMKAPDNRVLISTEGYAEWVETGGVLKLRRKAASKSVSRTAASGAGSVSRSNLRPLT